MTRILILTLLLPIAAIADQAWLDDYRYAIESLERGQQHAAISALEELVAEHPQPMRAGNEVEFDYIPHLNLAVAYYQLGDREAAEKALNRSLDYGVATGTYVGRQIWDQYALRIMASPATIAASNDGTADFRDFTRSEPVLSASEADELKQQVLRRCALTGKGPTSGLPWYFHYEYGTELLEAGDAQRAVDELILAANKRENSRRNSRMYGMWFTNYLPYFQIAQAHSQLGNWRCAMDAMRVSAENREYSPVDRGYEEYSDLQKLIRRQNDTEAG